MPQPVDLAGFLPARPALACGFTWRAYSPRLPPLQAKTLSSFHKYSGGVGAAPPPAPQASPQASKVRSTTHQAPMMAMATEIGMAMT